MKKENLKTWCLQNNKEYLIGEWDSERNLKELGLKIEDVNHGTDKCVYWKCSKHGHSWKAAPFNRKRNSNCPICNGVIVLEGFNDLFFLS